MNNATKLAAITTVASIAVAAAAAVSITAMLKIVDAQTYTKVFLQGHGYGSNYQWARYCYQAYTLYDLYEYCETCYWDYYGTTFYGCTNWYLFYECHNYNPRSPYPYFPSQTCHYDV